MTVFEGCAWCGRPLGRARIDSTFCGRKCRQTAFRLRRMCDLRPVHGPAIRVAYADPPYPGKARRYYGREPTYAGEVDFPALISSLGEDFPDGWALSTSAESLRAILPLCPPSVHLCPWVKPIGAAAHTAGLHTTWEPLLVVGGRQVPPGKRDWLAAQPARFHGTLMGRKPLAFCAFLFEALGLRPGDELVDVFPGTGMVGRAWREVSGVAREGAQAQLFPGDHPHPSATARGSKQCA